MIQDVAAPVPVQGAGAVVCTGPGVEAGGDAFGGEVAPAGENVTTAALLEHLAYLGVTDQLAVVMVDRGMTSAWTVVPAA